MINLQENYYNKSENVSAHLAVLNMYLYLRTLLLLTPVKS